MMSQICTLPKDTLMTTSLKHLMKILLKNSVSKQSRRRMYTMHAPRKVNNTQNELLKLSHEHAIAEFLSLLC